MLGAIPFQVPSQFAADLLSGNIVQIGSLLKETATGRIVAHMQETGLAQQILSSANVMPFSPLSALNSVSSIGANFQLVHLTRLVESLQLLQFVNLGATVAGIGVSAIGFALINKKLNRLGDQVHSIGSQMNSRFDEIRERELRTHYSRVHGIFDQAEQAHALSNPVPEWIRVASVMADESAYFRGEVNHLIQRDDFEPDIFAALTSSYSLCNSGRIECLMLSNQLPAARKVAQDTASDCKTMFDRMNPVNLARKLPAQQTFGGKTIGNSQEDKLGAMKSLVSNVRDMQDAANSKPYLLETLIARDVDGSEYMRRLRDERDQPILLLPAS